MTPITNTWTQRNATTFHVQKHQNQRGDKCIAEVSHLKTKTKQTQKATFFICPGPSSLHWLILLCFWLWVLHLSWIPGGSVHLKKLWQWWFEGSLNTRGQWESGLSHYSSSAGTDWHWSESPGFGRRMTSFCYPQAECPTAHSLPFTRCLPESVVC